VSPGGLSQQAAAARRPRILSRGCTRPSRRYWMANFQQSLAPIGGRSGQDRRYLRSGWPSRIADACFAKQRQLHARLFPTFFGKPRRVITTLPPPTFLPSLSFTHWSHVVPCALNAQTSFPSRPCPESATLIHTPMLSTKYIVGNANNHAATADEVLDRGFLNGAIQTTGTR